MALNIHASSSKRIKVSKVSKKVAFSKKDIEDICTKLNNHFDSNMGAIITDTKTVVNEEVHMWDNTSRCGILDDITKDIYDV